MNDWMNELNARSTKYKIEYDDDDDDDDRKPSDALVKNALTMKYGNYIVVCLLCDCCCFFWRFSWYQINKPEYKRQIDDMKAKNVCVIRLKRWKLENSYSQLLINILLATEIKKSFISFLRARQTLRSAWETVHDGKISTEERALFNIFGFGYGQMLCFARIEHTHSHSQFTLLIQFQQQHFSL